MVAEKYPKMAPVERSNFERIARYQRFIVPHSMLLQYPLSYQFKRSPYGICSLFSVTLYHPKVDKGPMSFA